MSGRVPVVLAVAIALVSGGLLGYGWRSLLAERDVRSATCPARIASPPLIVPQTIPSPVEPARAIFLGYAIPVPTTASPRRDVATAPAHR